MTTNIYEQIVLEVTLDDARNGRLPRTEEALEEQATRINALWADYLRSLKASRVSEPWDRVTVKLDKARTKEQLAIKGAALIINPEPGAHLGGLVLDDLANDGLDLPLNRINSPFSRLYLSNTAQPGKSVQLYALNPGWELDSTFATKEDRTDQTGFLVSNKTLHFTGAIATGAVENESLDTLSSDRIRIEGITLESVQALKYRIILWETSDFNNTNLNSDAFKKAQIIDLAAVGWQIGGANQYYGDVQNLNWLYKSNDRKLHIGLQNLSATSKSAGSAGEVVVKVDYKIEE